MQKLIEIMRRLRAKDGCPWDREQTLESMKHCLLEESYEVIDAIDSGDQAHHMEELGDVLGQIVFQSQIRNENGEFEFDDVVAAVTEKLIRRHPHVFGDATAETSAEVLKQWEEIKSAEKEKGGEGRSIVDGIPRHMPALLKA